jgi:hypothetical protein
LERFLSALERAEKRNEIPTFQQLGVSSASEALDVIAAWARAFRLHYGENDCIPNPNRPKYFGASWRWEAINRWIAQWERESGSSIAQRILKGYAGELAERRSIIADNLFRSSYCFDLGALDSESPDLKAVRADEAERHRRSELVRYQGDGRVASEKKVRDALDRFEEAVRTSSTAPSAHAFLGERLTRFQEGKLIEFLECAEAQVRAALILGLAGTRRAYWKGFLQRHAAVLSDCPAERR